MAFDPFFRADNFENKKWYNELQLFLRIGVCEVENEQAEEVCGALRKLGYETRTVAAKEPGYQMVIGNGPTEDCFSLYDN